MLNVTGGTIAGSLLASLLIVACANPNDDDSAASAGAIEANPTAGECGGGHRFPHSEDADRRCGVLINAHPINSEWILAGETLKSCNGQYKLTLTEDGNLELVGPSREVRWATGTGGREGHQLKMQEDGNLVLYTASKKAIWSSDTRRTNWLEVSDDGFLKVWRRRHEFSSPDVVWQSTPGSLRGEGTRN